MLKKSLFVVGMVASVIFTTSANAGWERYPYLSSTYDQKINGKLVARWFGVPQYGQPTTYTCGATTTSMQMAWETHKRNKTLKYSPTGIHSYINTSGGSTSGLTSDELKAGQKKIVDHINRTQGLGLTVSMAERKDSSIKNAVSTLATTICRNFSPAILYGNVKYASWECKICLSRWSLSFSNGNDLLSSRNML